MRNHFFDFQYRFLPAIIFFSILFSTSCLKAQTAFQIVWGMNGNLSGSSSNSNFAPANATLTGAHPHSLPGVLYYSLGGGDYAHGTTYWQASPGVEKYLEFSYSVSTFEYAISSVSFRVRRSGDGPANVSLRSSLDGFSSDLSVTNLSADGIFYDVTVPFSLNNLREGLSFRLYGSNAASFQGVLYFDQIVINGGVTSIVLPVQLTYIKATVIEKTVWISWETAVEHNSKAFVIERSEDLNKFLPIGSVSAEGEAAGRVEYSFLDVAPQAGANYYRLRLVDVDNSYTLSNTVDAIIHSYKSTFSVSPNPSNPTMVRIKTEFAEPTDYVLTNAHGQNIPVGYMAKDGNYINLFPNHALSSGFYVLSLKLDGKWERQKVLVP